MKEISEQKSLLGISAYSDAVKNAAANAISEIRRAETTKAGSPPDMTPRLPKPASSSEKQDAMFRLGPPKPSSSQEKTELTLAPPQERYDKIVIIEDESVSRNSDTIETSAITFLFNQIVMFAKQKDFVKAEELRQKLIELDPMALSEIVRAGEIIEQEKKEELHTGTSLWADLDENLSLEEAGALYEAIEDVNFQADQPLYIQGERNTKLYFIKEGRLKLVYRHGKTEHLVRTSEPGDIVGGDSFFFITFCTTSLITISGVSAAYLDKEVLSSWKEQYPQLEAKLYAYCQPHIESIRQFLKEKEIDRRIRHRIEVSGQVLLQLLKANGEPESKEFKGNLRDISAGGLSFSIKTSEKTAQVLLGRKLGVAAEIAGIAVRTIGMVIGVIHRHSSTYSIHVRFDEDLDKQIVNHIEKERK
ncbi:MAG: cyclic nucleotide-binding domain-containing protein [Desulfobacteraceae bacterium]|nr:cyclic nucleotide-binding domain-containing protein [Desulfobacteraceae bacterium]